MGEATDFLDKRRKGMMTGFCGTSGTLTGCLDEAEDTFLDKAEPAAEGLRFR